MNNVYLGLTAVLGAVSLCIGLYELIPQGMWLYLGAAIWGTSVTTWAILELKEEA